eukprot:GSMAST32.ASY1.ANO1.1141.1 assembled CDS
MKEQILPVLGSIQLQIQQLEHYTIPLVAGVTAEKIKLYEINLYLETEDYFVHHKELVDVALNGLLLVDAAISKFPVNYWDKKLPPWFSVSKTRANNEIDRSWAWSWARENGVGDDSGWREVIRSSTLQLQIGRTLAMAQGEEMHRCEEILPTSDEMNVNSAFGELQSFLVYKKVSIPKYWICKTPEIAMVGLLGIGIICSVAFYRGKALQAMKRSINSVKRWWYLHVTEPASEMFADIVFNEMIVISDVEAMEDSKLSLQKMIGDFLIDTKGDHHNLTDAEIAIATAKMDMSALSAVYDEEVKEPVKNLVTGDMVRLALIQVQFIKKELLTAMSAIDELLRENHFTAQLMATFPAFVIVSLVGLFGRFIWRVFLRSDVCFIFFKFEFFFVRNFVPNKF